MIIVKVDNLEEARKCNELLTLLIENEAKYNENINKNYIVNNWFENLYNMENNVLYVAKENEEIVGYIYCKINTGENGPTNNLEALIDGLYVLEEYRKKGIATALINKAKQWCRNKNVKYIMINVLEDNKTALNLYSKLNFTDYEKTLRFNI